MPVGEHADELASDQARPIPPRYWWLKRILLAAGVLILALAALRWWWGWEAERRLEAKIAEYRAAGQPVTIEDFQSSPIPDDENAAVLLRKAAAAIVTPSNSPITPGDVCGSLTVVANWADEVRALIEANASALRLARDARLEPKTDWQIPLKSPVMNVFFPDLSPQRNLARLLCAAALYQHQTASDAAAIEALRDALGQARQVGQMRGFLISHLVTVAIDAVAANAIEELAPQLRVAATTGAAPSDSRVAPPEQVRALIADLLDEEPIREQWRWAIYGERLFALDTVTLVASGRIGPGTLLVGGGGSSPFGPLAFIAKPMFQLDVVQMMEHCTAVARAGTGESYPAACDLFPEHPRRQPGIEGHARFLSRILLPSVHRALELHFRTIAMRRMAALALAVRLYEVDHGRRPHSLAELIPEYLSEIPLDPFAAGGRPLGYLPNAPCPILYSVNLDGVDDGGTYALRESGTVDWDAKDLPFFLDGDRPRQADPRLATRPATTQAVEDQSDKVGHGRQTDESQTADDQP
ncbi:MAG TPA: hypothetical protein VM487_17655 [Phycisphaerae bacterium]|nr:hypothetical protein [Phycisphaerae bacterium]